jgi:hypothetical protein
MATKKPTNTNIIKQPTQEELALAKRQEQFAAIRSMTMKQLNKSLQTTPSVLSRFDSKQVATFLQNPQKYEKQLRQLSNYLYNVNAQYKMLIRHMATLPIYAYDLELIGSADSYAPDKIKKAYLKTSQYVDKLNLSHEMSKMLKIAFKEDVFFGYEHESKDSYFIQKLDADYCQIGSSIEDGVLNFAFDFSYFDKFKNDLALYPEEFRSKHQIYENNKQTNRWQELDSNKAVCFKINEELSYVLPPFNTVFESVFDLDEYKKLKKARAKMDNFLLLVQKIPMNEKSTDMDAFLLDLTLANKFHENTSSNLPEGVGLTTSPMSFSAISLDKKQTNADSVNEAVREVFTDAGISQYLFNSEKNTSVGISKSITSDEQILFDVLRQIERWLNRKLKKQSGIIKFQVSLLDITRFSKGEEHDRLLKAAQFGSPNIMRIGATLGMSPNQLYNKAIIENNILDLHSIIKPLQSSHTTAGDEKGGAPNAPDNKKADSTQVNQDNAED